MKPVAHDGLHAPLAIGATRLLVGENVLERDHLGGKRGEILLGRIDDRQTLIEMGKGLRGAFRLVIEAKADALPHMVQPLIEGACKMRLCTLRLVGKIAQRSRHLGQPVFQLRARRMASRVSLFRLRWARHVTIRVARIRTRAKAAPASKTSSRVKAWGPI